MVNNSNKALKEWAITVKALDEGKQIILLRKGGIHEENKEFRVEKDRFLLYPTYEHQRDDLIKEEFRGDIRVLLQNGGGNNKVTIQNWAMIFDVAEITEPEKLKAILPYHIWTADYMRERLNWRPRKPLHILFLRVFRLSQPVIIDVLPEYGGCKSWLGLLGEEFFLEEAKPVLKEDKFKYIAEEIKGVLLKS